MHLVRNLTIYSCMLAKPAKSTGNSKIRLLYTNFLTLDAIQIFIECYCARMQLFSSTYNHVLVHSFKARLKESHAPPYGQAMRYELTFLDKAT